MPSKQNSNDPRHGGIQFSVLGLILFSVSLVFAGGLLVWFAGGHAAHKTPTPHVASSSHDGPAPQVTPAWGELVVRDIEVERPEEYVASEISTYQVPHWTFEGQTTEQVRKLLQECGLTPPLVARALSPELRSTVSNSIVIHPGDELVYAVSPEVRSKLYGELARWPANHFMQYPFCVPGKKFESWFENSNVSDAVLARIRKLVYSRGPSECFSDFEVVMRGLASEQEKLWLVKALSRQKGLLVRVRIRPDSDVDKIMGYWARGIQSVKRLPDGGTMSLLYSALDVNAAE